MQFVTWAILANKAQSNRAFFRYSKKILRNCARIFDIQKKSAKLRQEKFVYGDQGNCDIH